MPSQDKYIRKQAFRIFKTNQLTLTKPVLKCIQNIFVGNENWPEKQISEVLSALTLRIKKQNLADGVITKEIMETVIKEIENNNEEVAELETLVLVSSFDVKKFHYDKVRDMFELKTVDSPKAMTQICMERERYEIIYQRMHRHKVFKQPSISNRRKQAAYTVVTTDSISFDTNDRQTLFGALYENREGQIIVDGPGGGVRIDLSNAVLGMGLFTYNSMVLCEGTFNSILGHFEVESMGFPPKEARENTLTDFPVLNFFANEKKKKNS